MWTDQIDQANELAERERTAAAALRKPTLPKTGKCHWCGECVPDFAQFCGAECRDEYEEQEKRQRRAGVRR